MLSLRLLNSWVMASILSEMIRTCVFIYIKLEPFFYASIVGSMTYCIIAEMLRKKGDWIWK